MSKEKEKKKGVYIEGLSPEEMEELKKITKSETYRESIIKLKLKDDPPIAELRTELKKMKDKDFVKYGYLLGIMRNVLSAAKKGMIKEIEELDEYCRKILEEE